MVRRELILKSIVTIAISFVVLSAAPAKADLTNSSLPEIASYQQIGIKTLPNTSDYEWWYGCSPTSAGMMMGYYDRNGYDGLYYPDLVPGGVAEPETFVGPPTGSSALANQIIASSGHRADFYVTYGNIGNDPNPTTTRPFDCLADFMGTSQDLDLTPPNIFNVDGGTTFHFYTNGIPTHDYNLGGLSGFDGMYGIGEYVDYAGYDTTAQGLYTQLTDNNFFGFPDITSNPFSGFTFDDYINEIDEGRVVMLHVDGHSMFGYGYDDTDDSEIVYLHDTWALGEHSMTWGGTYPYNPTTDLGMWGVTVLELTGGDVVPVPAAVLLGMLGLGVVGIKLRRYA